MSRVAETGLMFRFDPAQHWVLCTKNTEYHLCGDECVGVRSRRSGRWQAGHAALRQRLAPLGDEALPNQVGRKLVLGGPRYDVVTATVTNVLRPSSADLFHYVSHSRAGTIEASAA